MLKLATMSLICSSMLFPAELKLGKPLTLKQATPITALASEPEKYVGQTVQAKGRVSEVCQKMGCWMTLVDESGKSVRIKVKDGGDIKFPKDASGKMATAEGTFAKLQLTKEQATAQAKHEAEVNGKKFDPATVAGPVTIYQINGQGAVIVQ